MTDQPINLAELREAASESHGELLDHLNANIVLALIDTAEAARELTGDSGEPPICLALGIKDRWRAQQRALSRFTTE